MRTAEDASGTVLHRLIQEQLRYGNPTDTRTLLAIQQQALRRGGGLGGGSGGGGLGSPRSSLESLTQEEPQSPQLSTRQEPQGQEHQADYQHSESYQLYRLHGEELPSYEEAKAHSQYLAPPQWALRGCSAQEEAEEHWDGRRSHARSLSGRLLQQLSLEHGEPAAAKPGFMRSSHSYPQITGYHGNPHPQACEERQGPPPEHLYQAPNFILSHPQVPEHLYSAPPPPFNSQHRHVAPIQSLEMRYLFPTAPPAGREVPHSTLNQSQVEVLLRENEMLRRELESHCEKANKIQKLEQEIQRISEAYETLMQGCSKRETLEQTLKTKLMGEVQKLQELNNNLRERLENTTKQAAKEVEVSDHNQHIMVKLLAQSEEQQVECERLEQEVRRLRVDEEEQGRRVESLEVALVEAGVRSRRLQEELIRKRAYVEKVERLQGALAQLQATCEKRELLEQRLRKRLEQELRSLRAQQRQIPAATNAGEHSFSVVALQERLREREERILALEADSTRWQQKYLEESTMREFAMDAAATAAAQRDTTIINHSPGHSSNSSFNEDQPMMEQRNQEVENRIRALHMQVLEKDAMINVLQQHLQQEREGGGVASLRSATSVPSLWSTSHPELSLSGPGKGRSRSDDQTCAGVFCTAVSPGPSQSQNQADLLAPVAVDTALREQGSSAQPDPDDIRPQQPQPQHQSRAVDPFKGLDDVEAEAVEIFI